MNPELATPTQQNSRALSSHPTQCHHCPIHHPRDCKRAKPHCEVKCAAKPWTTNAVMPLLGPNSRDPLETLLPHPNKRSNRGQVLGRITHHDASRNASRTIQVIHPFNIIHLALGQKVYPKWNPGKWKHGLKPVVVPWWFNFDPYPFWLSAGRLGQVTIRISPFFNFATLPALPSPSVFTPSSRRSR